PNEWIHRFSDRILLLYLWDVSPRNSGLAWWRKHWHDYPDEQFPGKGKLDFQGLADALKVSGCNAHKVICLHGTEDWSILQLQSNLQTALQFLQNIGLA
ncbi:MAG: hypothetical protein NZ937_09970, partial [Armatimonadetes bacterium]|nr:hypothetical protein [Armatimonadota bacterium]